MKLGEKITRTLAAAQTARGHDRFTLVAGLGWLACCFGLAIRVAILLPRGEYLTAAGYAANLPILLTFWGEAWRKAVDFPMGAAWFNLPGTRNTLAAGYALLAAMLLLAGSWLWAAFCGALALFWWRFNGGGGWGWDDPVDAPKPDPAASA